MDTPYVVENGKVVSAYGSQNVLDATDGKLDTDFIFTGQLMVAPKNPNDVIAEVRITASKNAEHAKLLPLSKVTLTDPILGKRKDGSNFEVPCDSQAEDLELIDTSLYAAGTNLMKGSQQNPNENNPAVITFGSTDPLKALDGSPTTQYLAPSVSKAKNMKSMFWGLDFASAQQIRKIAVTSVHSDAPKAL